MPLIVVKYGAPVLRQKGARIESITPKIRKLAADMLETVYTYKGVGLAAQQVGLPLQLTVIDVRGVTDRPSSLELAGKPADVDGFMPLVLINPEVKPVGPPATGSEGCLSFPEIYADITRPDVVDVKALVKVVHLEDVLFGLHAQRAAFSPLLARHVELLVEKYAVPEDVAGESRL